MPTPVVYLGAEAKPLFTDLPAARRTPPLELLFITDRAPAKSDEDDRPYSANRSRSVTFGSATIEFGKDLSWDELARQSVAAERSVELDLKLGATKEAGHYPPTPYGVARAPGGVTRAPAVLEAHARAAQDLQAEVARLLAAAPRKEMVLYVHGYANTFVDAAVTMGELCHFLGREIACGIFTWPGGGKRGILFGYQVDYESSQFAVEHLRKAIRTIAATPGLERLHLLAHSRGTDVLTTALSELSVEAYILKQTLPERFKIGNVILAAPDIDADIAAAKIFKLVSDPDLPHGGAPEPAAVIRPSPGFHVTVYASPDDKALATSGWLFGSVLRLGQVDRALLSPQQIDELTKLGLFDMIQVFGATDTFGHSYFVSNPRVSADIVSMLRYRLRPNQPGRPLEEVKRPFWRIPRPPESK